jgi:hypothetical protein
MSIYHDKIELVDYTFIRYRAVFIFILECTRLLPNEIYSVSVKYIFDYKVKFLRYTRTYSLNGRGCRGMIFFLEFIRFVSFLSLQILFRFVVFRFSLYRNPINIEENQPRDLGLVVFFRS